MVEHNRSKNCIHFLPIKETDCVLYVDENEQVRLEDESAFCGNKTYDYVIYRLMPAVQGGKEALADKISHAFKCVNAEGHLVLLMDNPYALHMFAGETDKEGRLFSPFLRKKENQVNISARILEEAVGEVLIQSVGTTENAGSFEESFVKWYYPYPTLEFPVAIYSDSYLPKSGECSENYYNFEYARLGLFQETEAFDEIIKSGMFREFANCYMLIVGKPFEEEINYSRYSNERSEGLRIRTDILDGAVRKMAYDEKSEGHIQSLIKWEEKLNQQLTPLEFLNKEVCTNKILKSDKSSVTFEFIKGNSLEQLLDKLLSEGKQKEAKELLLEFCRQLYNQKELAEFKITPDFEKVFGMLDEDRMKLLSKSENLKLAAPVTDIDMICQNVLIGDKVFVIDYEWTFDFEIPVGYLIYRILFFYLEFQNRKACFEEDLYALLGIDEELKKLFARMETGFQQYVQGDTKLISDSYYEVGKPVLLQEQLKKYLTVLEQSAVKIVLNTGNGVREEIRECKKDSGGILSFTIDFEPGEVQDIKIFPGIKNAFIRVCMLKEDETGSKEIGFTSNGLMFNQILGMFDREAEIQITDIGAEVYRIYISLEVVGLSDTFVVESKRSILELRETLSNREKQLHDLLNSASWRLTKPLRKLKGNKENE